MNYMYIESAKKVIKYIPVAFLGFVTVWLRFSNLWYSDYQGDEIKALFIPNPGQSVVDFLLTQRKGPIQFLVTFLVKLVDPTYANEFLTRLPFALAGALAIYFFYKFVSRQFGKKIALYSSLFLSVNGIIVAFSRIAQYQSFVILFCVLALYLFSLALNCDGWRYKGIYLGAVAWALALLAHYDAVLIFPYALYLVIKWYKKHPQNALKHLAFASVVPGLLLSAFYIPFVLSINPATKEYWADRLSGGSDKLSSSIVTFKTYNPKLIFYIYSLLFIASLVKIKTVWAVFLWTLVPWVFMEVVTNVPGTHIYTYLMPLSVLLAFGIAFIDEIVEKVLGQRIGVYANAAGLVVLFVFMAFLAHAVFVDHTQEYPWEPEHFLIWELPKPNVIFHLSLFGFPYYRHWEEIGDFINEGAPAEYYSTNERDSISRYYVALKKDTNLAGYFIYIAYPQSFTHSVTNPKAAYWMQKASPVKSFYNNNKEVARVYYMPTGDLATIKSLVH